MAGFVLNGFNIGQDISVQFQSDGGVAGGLGGGTFTADNLGHLMNFSAEIIDKEIDVIPISNLGRPLYDTVYHGWRGKLTFTRVNGQLTNLLADLMNKFFNSGTRVHFNISVTVLNRDGTTDRVNFTQCSLSKGTFGDFKADKEVDQSFSFRAQNMTSTAGSLATQAGANL
jgi:hypothetical protein